MRCTKLVWLGVVLAACGSGTPTKPSDVATDGHGGSDAGGAGASSRNPPSTDGGDGSGGNPLDADAGGVSSNGPSASAGATNALGGDAAAGADGNAGGSGHEWTGSDVTPIRTRVGPQTTPQQLFASELQLGAYWETPSGDVLTSFRTSITQPQAGVAIYDYHYTLQTIVGADVQPVPGLDVEPSGWVTRHGSLQRGEGAR